jgi:outer membrane protein assembly factor BamA
LERLLVLGLLALTLFGVGGLGVAMAGPEPEPAQDDTSLTDWAILPVAFHTPETGTGGGIAGAYFYKQRVEARPSSIAWIAFYTEKKQTILGLESESYLSGGSRRLLADAGYEDYPDVFYGIGSGTKADDGEDYSEKHFSLDLTYEFEIMPDLRVGPRLGFRRSHITEVEDGGRLASSLIPGAEKHSVTVAGLVLVYDKRDNIFYTRNGSFIQFKSTYSGSMVGSDYRYSKHTLDARRFFGLGNRHAIGFKTYFAAAEGSLPFQSLTGLGGDKLMRGFRHGRFRDKLAYVAQAEYRLKLIWRFGFAAFAALGDVSRDIDGFGRSSVKHSGGAGIRFRFNDEGYNLRLDMGFTEEGSGFYFIAGEAF